MITINGAQQKITVDGSETVKFSPAYPMYAIKGEEFLASFNETFTAASVDVADTSDTGWAMLPSYVGKDTIYLQGSGDVIVKGGQSPLDFLDFKKKAKGGDSGGTEEAFDMRQFTITSAESAMSATIAKTQVQSTWNGGSAISLKLQSSDKISLDDIDKIRFEVITGSCYGNGNFTTENRFGLFVGVIDIAMPAAVATAISTMLSANNNANGYFISNRNVGTCEIDVSALTGERYLALLMTGWNATVSNLRLVKNS